MKVRAKGPTTEISTEPATEACDLVPPIPPMATKAQTTAKLLDDIVRIVKRHVVVSDTAALAVGLWTMHSWVLDGSETAPRLMINSATMRSGKTTLLTILHYLVPKPLAASNLTPATLFRVIDIAQPTLLIDEADTFMKTKELYGVLNCGHKRENAFVLRMSGRLPCQQNSGRGLLWLSPGSVGSRHPGGSVHSCDIAAASFRRKGFDFVCGCEEANWKGGSSSCPMGRNNLRSLRHHAGPIFRI